MLIFQTDSKQAENAPFFFPKRLKSGANLYVSSLLNQEKIFIFKGLFDLYFCALSDDSARV